MSFGKEENPFSSQLAMRRINSDKNISPEDIRIIVGKVDCIKYHIEFIEFIEEYWEYIILHQEAVLSVLRVCVAIKDICKLDLSKLIADLSAHYENTMINQPIMDMDINIIFGFMRIFLDCGTSLKLCLLILSARIISITPDDIPDAYNIISNNQDVLKEIYKDDGLGDYRYVLDNIISEKFG